MQALFCLGLIYIAFVNCSGCSNNTEVTGSGISYVWTDGIIPYEFNSDFPSENRDKFLEATKYIEERTCVRFKPKTSEDRFWIRLVLGGCCSAYMGRRPEFEGRGQAMTMSRNLPLPFYLHELGHTVGFPHEQDRPDRDDFIFWDKNKDNCRGNGFAGKVEDMDQAAIDIPFDYVSLMADWTECYWPKPPTPKDIPLGPGSSNDRTFSIIDIERINAVHGCRGCSGYRFVKISQLAHNIDTVPAGHELDGRTFDICRVYHQGHLVIGKSFRDENRCRVAFDGAEAEYKEGFSVLTNPGGDADLNWVVGGSLRFPMNLIKGGRTRDRETLYIGRCVQKFGERTSLIPGFYLESNPSELRVPFGGGVRICRQFEVLACDW